VAPPVAGMDASVKFLAIADLGNAEQDGSLEVNAQNTLLLDIHRGTESLVTQQLQNLSC